MASGNSVSTVLASGNRVCTVFHVSGLCSRAGCSKRCALNPRTGDDHRFCSLRCAHAQKRDARRTDVTQAPATQDEPDSYADFQLDLLRAMEMSRMQFMREMGQLQSGSAATNRYTTLPYQNTVISRASAPLPFNKRGGFSIVYIFFIFEIKTKLCPDII